METLHQLVNAGENFSHVIIKTDLAYLVDALRSYIWKWTSNRFTNLRELLVINGKAFRYLHEKFGLVEKEYGIPVSFCKVDRKFYQHADRLAQSSVA